jgi:hypothetical protein
MAVDGRSRAQRAAATTCLRLDTRTHENRTAIHIYIKSQVISCAGRVFEVWHAVPCHTGRNWALLRYGGYFLTFRFGARTQARSTEKIASHTNRWLGVSFVAHFRFGGFKVMTDGALTIALRRIGG